MKINPVLKFSTFLTIIFLSHAVNRLHAQSIAGNVGWYFNINPAPSLERNFNLKQRSSFSLDLYLKSLAHSDIRSCFGIRFAHLSVRSKPINPAKENAAFEKGLTYKLISLLVNYRRKIYQREKLYMLLNLSSGLSFRSSRFESGLNQCDTIGCNLPEVRISFQPGIEYLVRISDTLSFHSIVRLNYMHGNKQEIYPFSSGLLFEAGFVLYGGSKI